MTSYPSFDGTQACAAEPTLFITSADDKSVTDAVALCGACRFLENCRSYALTHDVRGIWGGLADEARKASRARDHLPEPRSITDELDDLVLRWRADAMTSSGSGAI